MICSEGIEQEDPVTRIERLELIVQQCSNLLVQCTNHLQQFPTARLDVSTDKQRLQKQWLELYLYCNEEVRKADRFSVSDLLFVTLCHLDMALHVEWRSAPLDVDQDIDFVLDALRFFACQHTPETMSFWPTSEMLERLCRTVAWVVVYKLSAPMTDGRAKNQNVASWLMERDRERQLKSLSWMSSDPSIMERMRSLQSFAEPPKTAEGKFVRQLEMGQFFSEVNTGGQFLPQSARILHGLALEEHVLTMFELVPRPEIDGLDKLKAQMQKWLVGACSIDSNDDFNTDFRSAMFELCLPINSRAFTRTRKQNQAAEVVSLTLLQYELGFDVANKLSDLLSVRVRSIGFDPKHMLYDFMALHMFAYVMKHEQRVMFMDQFYVGQSELLKSLPLLCTTTKFRRNRDPVVVRLKRSFFIQYIDSRQKRPVWIACRDGIEVCLLWLHVLATHYEHELLSGHNLQAWSKPFLTLSEPVHTGETD